MARKIKFNDNDIENILSKMREHLRLQKPLDTNVNFTQRIDETDETAELVFSNIAWIKIKSLVEDFDGEVQWHGFVERIGINTFVVTDIVVFPHEVTSTTVVSDQNKYNEWLNNLSDEKFNSMRFHGHSHVNMGVMPSAVDNDYRESIVTQISPNDDNAYYIFIIINKKNDIEAQIFDIGNNIVYTGKSDINITVLLSDNETQNAFLEEAHTLATRPVYVVPEKKKKKKNYYGYEGYSSMFDDN